MVVRCGWSVKHKRILPAVLLSALLAVGATVLLMALRNSSLPGLGRPASTNGEDALSYAVVVDAGSSGSRVYLFQWSSPAEDAPAARGGQLLRIDQVRDAEGEPLVMKLDPGLSSCQDQPSRALAYMRPLLDFAARHIPTAAHLETQLFILATAGLRLIPEEASAALLRELRTHVPLHYAFLLPEGNVQVISGREEGEWWPVRVCVCVAGCCGRVWSVMDVGCHGWYVPLCRNVQLDLPQLSPRQVQR